MSWLNDIIGIFNAAGAGANTSSVSSASNAVNVSVNPAILNTVDLSALASPLQNLVDAMTLGQAVELQAAQIQADAVKGTASSLQEQFGKLATWVALATLGVSAYRLMGASK